MFRDQFGHLKHRNLSLAAKHPLELGVGIDHTTIDIILQLVPLDVLPNLLGDLGARNSLVANHIAKSFRESHWAHESCVRFTLGFFASRLPLRGRFAFYSLLLGYFSLSSLFLGCFLLSDLFPGCLLLRISRTLIHRTIQ